MINQPWLQSKWSSLVLEELATLFFGFLRGFVCLFCDYKDKLLLSDFICSDILMVSKI